MKGENRHGSRELNHDQAKSASRFCPYTTDLSKDLKQTLETALFDKRCTPSELRDLSGKIAALESVAVEFETVIYALSAILKPLRAIWSELDFESSIRRGGRGHVTNAELALIRQTVAQVRDLVKRLERREYFSNEIDTKLEQGVSFLSDGLEHLAQMVDQTEWTTAPSAHRGTLHNRATMGRRPVGSRYAAMEINGVLAATVTIGKHLMSLIGNLRLAKSMITKLQQDVEADISPWWRFWDRTDMDEAKQLIGDMKNII